MNGRGKKEGVAIRWGGRIVWNGVSSGRAAIGVFRWPVFVRDPACVPSAQTQNTNAGQGFEVGRETRRGKRSRGRGVRSVVPDKESLEAYREAAPESLELDYKLRVARWRGGWRCSDQGRPGDVSESFVW